MLLPPLRFLLFYNYSRQKMSKINTNIFKFCDTARNLHFLSKNSTLISRENCRFLGVKNSWKCCGFGLFSCWQLWFHEKNCQKNCWWKTRENVGVLSKLNFWTKVWLFEWCGFSSSPSLYCFVLTFELMINAAANV